MKLLLKLALGLLLVPLVSFAARDDASLANGTLLTVDSLSFTVTGSNGALLDSIAVDSSTLTLVMSPDSRFQITSADRRTITASGLASVKVTHTCSSSESVYLYENPASAPSASTVTLTIDSGTCGAASGGGSPGGGGSTGGGGGASTPSARPQKVYPDGTIIFLDEAGSAEKAAKLDAKFAVKAAAPKTVVAAAVSGGSGLSAAQVNSILALLQSFNAEQSVIDNVRISLGASAAVQAPAGASTGYTFSKALKAGSTGAEVRELQKALNSDSDTQVASSGAGSPGNESALFGPATLAAVKKFQEKYGIAGPGVEGYGNVGPATRAKLNELSGSAGVTVPSGAAPQTGTLAGAVSGSITKSLAPGVTDLQVKILQRTLNSDPDTQIAESGAGSPGNETSYFGSATLKAVKKFQEKYGISGPGDSGYGLVGPKTRAKIRELNATAQ